MSIVLKLRYFKEMYLRIVLFSLFNFVLCKNDCYWNRQCPYQLFSSKTPYDTVRGDLRDISMPDCELVSLWSLHRHGNRNPGSEVIDEIKLLQKKIIDEVKIHFENNRTLHYCSQDIEDLLQWSWNTTLETSASYLTGVGYEELYDLGKRVRQKFSQLLSADKFYFRPTYRQRTVTSSIAFVNGFTDGTGLNLTANIDEPLEADSVIRPYDNCDKYKVEVKDGQALTDELAAYDSSPEVLAVRDNVQKHLGINYQLSVADTYNLYELCRFHRSWSPDLRSPWCSMFNNDDLIVMEYRDDVRHYYKNGYGSHINVNLGAAPLKDLYENFEMSTLDKGRKMVSYFSHDTMFEMTLSALGLNKDSEPIRGSSRNPNRLWRTSDISAFSVNLIAVLFKCQEEDKESYRVQILINEKPTTICPDEGCTWQEFVDRFQIFTNSTINFCSNNDYDFESNGYQNIPIMKILLIFSLWLVSRYNLDL